MPQPPKPEAGLGRAHRRTKHLLAQQTGGGERLVAHHFRGEPDPWPAGEEAVGGIAPRELVADVVDGVLHALAPEAIRVAVA